MGKSWLPEVIVVNEQERPVNCRRLVELAQSVIAAEERRGGTRWHAESELNVVIGDDRWIQELNRKYRNKDMPTDVLAFGQDVGPTRSTAGRDAAPTGKEKGATTSLRLLGDVAISAEAAARQAEEFGHGFEEEMAILLAHGILHLTGWRDETAGEKREMMRRVEEVLAEARAKGWLPRRQVP